jgi:H+/Cl- antiporter ClcA
VAGLFALAGSAAMLAATTQGLISAIVQVMELTGFARVAILPPLLAVTTATLIARAIAPWRRCPHDRRDRTAAERVGRRQGFVFVGPAPGGLPLPARRQRA